jgi:uncharacterized protein YbaP (TraB family)
MKTFVLPVAVLTASLAALPVEADEKRRSRAWLDSRGVLSLTDLEKTVGVRLSPSNRPKLDSLLAQRNAQLVSLNEQITGVLNDDLKTTDAQLASRVEQVANSPWNPDRLETIRRTQPMRYQGLLQRQKQELGK